MRNPQYNTIFALVKRARLRKRNLTAQTSTPMLAPSGESLSLFLEKWINSQSRSRY
uniref:Uncharacterized protein n=1 Tax=virus sp. ctoYX9 TaxID=2825822 RepID=A0A8S5RNW7_9VIRU|nr:MAG TPA: hypothetical protein [virus sp. ctoYX9]